MVARQHGVNPNQLFRWRKLYQNGSLSAVSAGEEVVPASELSDALKQIGNCSGCSARKPWRTRFSRKPSR
jgi:transposase